MNEAQLLARLRRPRSAPKCCLEPTCVSVDISSFLTFDENNELDRERRAMSARHKALPVSFPARRRPKSCLPMRNDERQLSYETRGGYSVKRSRSRVDVVIQPERFFTYEDQLHRLTPRPSTASVPKVMSEQDELIEQLEERVGQLTLYLEEERADHRETKRQFEERLSTDIEELEANHQSEITFIKQKNKEEYDELVNGHKKEVEKMQHNFERERRQFQRDIETVQAQFESYKTQLHIETTQRLKDQEARLKEEFISQSGAHAEEFNERVQNSVELATETLRRDMDTKISNLKRDHKREIDELFKKFGDSVALAQQVLVFEKELEKRNAEYEKLLEKHEQMTHQFRKLEVDLIDAKEEINDWRGKFDKKVKEVDASYREQIEELKQQALDAKSAFIDKCAAIHRERVTYEARVDVRATSAKNMMKQVIESRLRTDMPLTAGQELVDVEAEIKKAENKQSPAATANTMRRYSAPGSTIDEKKAYVNIAQLSSRNNALK